MRWKLLTTHYINDALVDEGTIVGDGCQHDFKRPDGSYHPPSLNMEPADAEAAQYLKDHPRKFGPEVGKAVPMEMMSQPVNVMPGQRLGGLGPKAENKPQVPGQGPITDVEQLMINKVLNAPAKSDPFET